MTDNESIPKQLRAQVEACETWITQQLPTWQTNVNYRKNKILDGDLERDEVAVPIDAARTRNKIAQLFFQVPKIALFPRAPQWRPTTPLTAAVVNHLLAEEIHAEEPVEESLGDAINAAGIGILYVSYEAGFVDEKVPAVDMSARSPEEIVAYAKELGGQPPPMMTKKVPLYQKVDISSVDPADFLRPLGFTKINWDNAPWLGHKFRLTEAEARRKGWLKEGERAGGESPESVSEAAKQNADKEQGKHVSCIRLWYRPYLFDPKEPDCRKIKVIVWVDGQDKTEPVLHEDFRWQKYVPETREWVGMTKFPLRPLTLEHISGEAIPPSATEYGRPQVRELNKSRTQMVQQRDRSFPLRWYDVNLVDEEIVEQIRRGTWQDMIPTQGPGTSVIGEVSRASFPRESYEFNTVLNQDLDMSWSSGPNQGGYEAAGSTSATEAEITQRNFQVSLEHQRAKVLKWFLQTAECVLDLVQMFYTVEKFVPFTKLGGEKALEAWDRETVPGKFVFSARPDAATRIDVSQKRAEANNRYKVMRHDPLVNPQRLIADVFESSDVDPTEGFAPPAPPQEQKPKPASFSFKGDDLVNPMVVALIQKSTPITPQELQAARYLMADAGVPIAPATTLPDTTQVDTDASPSDAPPVNGETQPHGGMTGEVLGVGRRYEAGSGGQKDPEQGMIGENTGKV
jgi:hypothetical protein